MIVDTDILIWYMRGLPKARRFLDSFEDFAISAVTHMELVQGMRNKIELKALRSFMRQRELKIHMIDEAICSRAMFYMEEYFLTHNLRMADALIGATAVVNDNTLATGNNKHYRMLKDLSIKQFVFYKTNS